MATAQARRLCPEAVVISSDFSSYIEASEAIAGIFESVTPNVEPIALDEAFLDVSGAHRLFGTSPEIAWHLRRTIRSEVGLDCSVGVASTKTLAKLASVAAKPVVGDDGPQPVGVPQHRRDVLEHNPRPRKIRHIPNQRPPHHPPNLMCPCCASAAPAQATIRTTRYRRTRQLPPTGTPQAPGREPAHGRQPSEEIDSRG